MGKFIKEHLPRFALLVFIASCVYATVSIVFAVLKTEAIQQTATAYLFGLAVSFVFCLAIAGILILSTTLEKYHSALVDFLCDWVLYFTCFTGGSLLTQMAVNASGAINHATSGAVPTLELTVNWGWQIFASGVCCALFMSIASAYDHEYDFNLFFRGSHKRAWL